MQNLEKSKLFLNVFRFKREELNKLAEKMDINLDFKDWDCRNNAGTFFKDPRPLNE